MRGIRTWWVLVAAVLTMVAPALVFSAVLPVPQAEPTCCCHDSSRPCGKNEGCATGASCQSGVSLPLRGIEPNCAGVVVPPTLSQAFPPPESEEGPLGAPREIFTVPKV